MKYLYITLKFLLKMSLICIYTLLKYSLYKEKTGGIYKIHFIHPHMLNHAVKMKRNVICGKDDTTEFPTSDTGLAYMSLFTLPFVIIGLIVTENMKVPSWYPSDIDWSAIALIYALSTSISYVFVRAFGYKVGEYVYELYKTIDNKLIRSYDIY